MRSNVYIYMSKGKKLGGRGRGKVKLGKGKGGGKVSVLGGNVTFNEQTVCQFQAKSSAN